MAIVQLFLLELCVRYYPWTIQLPTPVTHTSPSLLRLSNSRNNGGNNGVQGSASAAAAASQGPDHILSRASRYHSPGWYKEHALYLGAHFWNWSTIGPYYLFLAVLTLAIGLSLLIIGNTDFYVGLLGLAVSVCMSQIRFCLRFFTLLALVVDPIFILYFFF